MSDATEPAGVQLARALGLNPTDITSVEITPLDHDPTTLLVTITSQRYLHPRLDTTLADLIEFITHHRLIPIDEFDTTTVPHQDNGEHYTTLDEALDRIDELNRDDDDEP